MENMDTYIGSLNPHLQEIVQNIRNIIREQVPEVQETIAGDMPAFLIGEKTLLYLMATDQYIGIHASHSLPDKNKLHDKGWILFPVNNPIPRNMIRLIAAHRANDILEI